MLIIPETLPAPVTLSIVVAYFNLLLWIAYMPVGFLHPKRKKTTMMNHHSGTLTIKKKRKTTRPLEKAIYAIE